MPRRPVPISPCRAENQGTGALSGLPDSTPRILVGSEKQHPHIPIRPPPRSACGLNPTHGIGGWRCRQAGESGYALAVERPRVSPGTLHVVATPIGNLGDITLRALDVLRSVALVACEDTRHTRPFLDHHGIKARLTAFHKFNEAKAAPAIVRRLLEGESVALVCDGGTPAFADPGYSLVRAALDAGIAVTPIPGPCAMVAAVSASGLPSDIVTFRGFLPHRPGERRRFIEAIRAERATQVLYESPHRVAAALRDLAEILGDRRAAVAREITKRFESWYRGSLAEVAALVAEAPSKGEFCIVIEGDQGAQEPGPCDPAALRASYDEAIASGLDRREALLRAARSQSLTRKEAYRLLKTR